MPRRIVAMIRLLAENRDVINATEEGKLVFHWSGSAMVLKLHTEQVLGIIDRAHPRPRVS
jgi:hypothetical protein